MKRLLCGLAGLAGLMLLAAAPARALMPIPSGECSANEILYAVDANNASCTAAPSLATSLTIGSGTAVTKITVTSITITSLQLAANTCTEVAYAATGLTTSDKVFLNPQFALGTEGFIASARVAAADFVEVIICNHNSVSTDPETGTVSVVAIRS